MKKQTKYIAKKSLDREVLRNPSATPLMMEFWSIGFFRLSVKVRSLFDLVQWGSNGLRSVRIWTVCLTLWGQILKGRFWGIWAPDLEQPWIQTGYLHSLWLPRDIWVNFFNVDHPKGKKSTQHDYRLCPVNSRLGQSFSIVPVLRITAFWAWTSPTRFEVCPESIILPKWGFKN